jgi:hypothetical protein
LSFDITYRYKHVNDGIIVKADGGQSKRYSSSTIRRESILRPGGQVDGVIVMLMTD